ncbi:MAG: copper amine oxidase N-terminal domain-containing protein [Syntrophomonas sp.]
MKKPILRLIVIFIVIISSAGLAQANPSVILDGQQLSFDVPPIIENGSTLVPLRAIFEPLGANVTWDDTTQTVTAIKAGTEVQLNIGESVAFKNGFVVNLPVPAQIVNGRTLVPLRFVSEALGANVEWNQLTESIAINSSGNISPASENNSQGNMWQKVIFNYPLYCDEKVMQTSDGGYLIGGTYSDVKNPGFYVWAHRLNSNGEVIWEKNLGSTFMGDIKLTKNDGFIIAYNDAGTTNKSSLIQYDRDGNKKWVKGINLPDCYITQIQPTNDNGFVLACLSQITTNDFPYHAYLLKHSQGTIQQTIPISTSPTDCIEYAQQTVDGGYIITGDTKSDKTGNDIFVMKLDKSSKSEWSVTLSSDGYDRPKEIQQTNDGNYILSTITNSFKNQNSKYLDSCLVKLDKNGSVKWQKVFNDNMDNIVGSFQQLSDGDLILCGYKGNYDSRNSYLLKLDNNGTKLWEKSFILVDKEWFDSVQQTSDGGYITVGGSDKRLYIVKTNQNGNTR